MKEEMKKSHSASQSKKLPQKGSSYPVNKDGIQRVFNVLPSRDTDKDWKYSDLLEAGAGKAAGAPPSSCDLRAAWWSIRDQLDSGACVGFATADSVVRWHLVHEGRLSQTELVSPRFTWMASKETDTYVSYPTTMLETAGTFLKAALDTCRKWGVVKESTLPFRPEHLYRLNVANFFDEAASFRIKGYMNVSIGAITKAMKVLSWRMWLSQYGPILTRLDVDATWSNCGSNGKLDIYKPETVIQPAGHAVALVGYTPKSFIVRNSWGTTLWGDQGYGYASLDYACAAFTEAYGVIP